MQFLGWLNDTILIAADPLFNWLLRLPLDVALIVVAVGTAFILTIVRIWTTDQNLLKRCADDKKRLNELIKEAKALGDKEAAGRCKATKNMIAVKSLGSELKPLIWVIIPIAVLGTWAFNRLGYRPPKADEPVEIVAYLPVSLVGQLIHIIPVDGVEAENGWVQEVRLQELTEEQQAAGLQPDGEAAWTLKAKASDEPYRLLIRCKDRTLTKELLVGRKTYSAVWDFYGEDGALVPACETRLEEMKLFGIVPGIPAVGCPPWLVAYLIIAVIFVFVLKPLLGIY